MFKVNLMGRLGRNAGVYETSNGNKFVAFTVAVNTKNLGKDVTYWVDVRSFNQHHIRLAQYLTKGKMVQVGGDYNSSITTDKVGVARISHNINADFIMFMNLVSPNKNEDNNTSSSHDTEVSTRATSTNDENLIVMNTPPLAPPVQEMVPVGVGVGASSNDDDLPF